MKMRTILFLTLLCTCLNAGALSSLEFISGKSKDFNSAFVKKYIHSALKQFGFDQSQSEAFQVELNSFIELESDNLYFSGRAGEVKKTKFYFTFIIEKGLQAKTLLTFFSSQKVLSTWNLSDFSVQSKNYSILGKNLPESCKNQKKLNNGGEFLSFNLKTKNCVLHKTNVDFSHPVYKGYVELLSDQEKIRIQIVKNLISGMTPVPTSVKKFGIKWRTPPSRYINRKDSSELYMP